MAGLFFRLLPIFNARVSPDPYSIDSQELFLSMSVLMSLGITGASASTCSLCPRVALRSRMIPCHERFSSNAYDSTPALMKSVGLWCLLMTWLTALSLINRALYAMVWKQWCGVQTLSTQQWLPFSGLLSSSSDSAFTWVSWSMGYRTSWEWSIGEANRPRVIVRNSLFTQVIVLVTGSPWHT